MQWFPVVTGVRVEYDGCHFVAKWKYAASGLSLAQAFILSSDFGHIITLKGASKDGKHMPLNTPLEELKAIAEAMVLLEM